MSGAQCPACRHAELSPLDDQRSRCTRCGWLCRITASGEAVDAIQLAASKQRRDKAVKAWKRRHRWKP